jgi:hypothetical protein
MAVHQQQTVAIAFLVQSHQQVAGEVETQLLVQVSQVVQVVVLPVKVLVALELIHQFKVFLVVTMVVAMQTALVVVALVV